VGFLDFGFEFIALRENEFEWSGREFQIVVRVTLAKLYPGKGKFKTQSVHRAKLIFVSIWIHILIFV
jgi:hypothetical protein